MAQSVRSPSGPRSSSPLSSHASSSRTSILSDDTAPTSMSGSFYNTGNYCHCKLANEAELRNLYREHARSTQGLWHGPVLLSEWKDQFFPETKLAIPEVDFASVAAEHGQTAFADCIYKNNICDTLFPRAGHLVHGKDHVTGVHHALEFALLSQNLKMDHDSCSTRDELLSSTVAFGAFTSEDGDPCAFGNGRPDSDKAASMRGRLAATVQAIAASSHRTFVYAFILMPKLARVIRFDHSGIVYSEVFPWRTSSDLIDFLIRFNGMSASERGYDTSVAPISYDSSEVLRAKEILAGCDALPMDVTPSTVIPPDYESSLSLMRVYDEETKSFHRVIVHRAISSADVFTGRATRGFYGVDLDEELVVYVKDAWRINSSSTAPEAATYRRLNKKDVPHLAGFYFGGDVPVNTPDLPPPESDTTREAISQTTTRTCEFVGEHPEYSQQESGLGIRLHSYVHHRLLFKKIGRPLKTFESTRQLCTALLNAIEAHGAAYEDARVLHRDISGGNILIDKDGKGMLIDWDMCVWLENKEEVEKIGQKVGTWRFLSAGLLEDRRGPRQHLLRDDLESFAHVLFYFVLRYRPTVSDSQAKAELRNDMHNVFDLALPYNDGKDLTCSAAKAAFLNGNGRFPAAFFAEHVQPQALVALIYDVLDVFAPVYTPVPRAKPWSTQAQRAAISEATRRQKEAAASSTKRLESTEYLASRFRHWIYDYHDPAYPELVWCPDDGAVDQFQTPPAIECAAPSDNIHSSRKRRAAEDTEDLPLTKSPRLSAKTGDSAGAFARAISRRLNEA